MQHGDRHVVGLGQFLVEKPVERERWNAQGLIVPRKEQDAEQRKQSQGDAEPNRSNGVLYRSESSVVILSISGELQDDPSALWWALQHGASLVAKYECHEVANPS